MPPHPQMTPSANASSSQPHAFAASRENETGQLLASSYQRQEQSPTPTRGSQHHRLPLDNTGPDEKLGGGTVTPRNDDALTRCDNVSATATAEDDYEDEHECNGESDEATTSSCASSSSSAGQMSNACARTSTTKGARQWKRKAEGAAKLSKKRRLRSDEDGNQQEGGFSSRYTHNHVIGEDSDTQCDLGCDESTPSASASSSSPLLEPFFEAMSLINPIERRGWDEALKRCDPVAWRHESCPCYFLRAANRNPWDAASKACAYWNERIQLFEDRAFDPLTAGSCSIVSRSGGSTNNREGGEEHRTEPTGLSPADVAILETGSKQLLPCDREGRTVLFLDRALLHSDMQHDTVGRLRVLFYLLQKAFMSSNISSGLGGASGADQQQPPQQEPHRLVVVALCSRPPKSGYNWTFSARGMKICAAMPIRVEAYHLLTLPAASGTGRILMAVVAACAGMLGKYFQSQTTVHHGAEVVESSETVDGINGLDPRLKLLQELKKHGLFKKGLPECAGGTFTLDSFQSWLKKQRRAEQMTFWTPEQRRQRRRDMNRIYSMNKRQRRRQEFRDLQDQANRLECANIEARHVQAELERLLILARRIVTGANRRIPADTAESATCLERALLPPQGPFSADTSVIPDALRSSPINSAVASPSSGFLQMAASSKHFDSGGYLSSVLAALEPDPIAPSLVHAQSDSSALEPDPIAPSRNRQAESSRRIDLEDLAHLRQALTAWDVQDRGVLLSSGVNYDRRSLQGTNIGPTIPGVVPMNTRSSSSAASTILQQPEMSYSSSSAFPHDADAHAGTSSASGAHSSLLSLQSLFPFFCRSSGSVSSSQPLHASACNMPEPFESFPTTHVPAKPGVGSCASENQFWSPYRSRTEESHAPSSPPSVGHQSRELKTVSSHFNGNAGSESFAMHDAAALGGYALAEFDDSDPCEPLDHRVDALEQDYLAARSKADQNST